MKPHNIRAVPGKRGEHEHVLLADPPQHDGVDLDRPQRGMAFTRGKAGEHAVQVVTAGDLRKPDRVKAVDAHVEATQARTDERVDVVVEQDAVGGHADLTDAGDGPDTRHDRGDVGPHQRLAAGDTDVAYAERGQDRNEVDQFVRRRDRRPREPPHPRGRHAVAAS